MCIFVCAIVARHCNMYQINYVLAYILKLSDLDYGVSSYKHKRFNVYHILGLFDYTF